jgi:methyl-accepting chemotaxis protein
VQTTSEAGEALAEIIHMTEQVGSMVMQIATAATQQSVTTEDINRSMEQISNLVKESAAGAQQSAKACQDLSGMAFELQKIVSTFNFGDAIGSERDENRIQPPQTRYKAMSAAVGR